MSLGRGLRAGLPVPPGFALSVDLVETVAAGQAEAVASLESIFGRMEGSLAVRSSAVGEDSAEASFAGQHETILNVDSHPALVDAVRRIRESANFESALAYRRRLGIDERPRIGVAVQELIAADCAGVLFTRDPISGADELVIEAAWGLGEAVVSGLVEPDHYRLSPAGHLLSSRAGLKDIAITLNRDGGTAETPVEERRAGSLCLDTELLTRLHALALACVDHYHDGLDIEWAVRNGELYLLQCRAITRQAGTGRAGG